MIPVKYAPVAQHFSDIDTDVVFYSGSIAREGYDRFCAVLQRPRRAKLLLVLNTYGGDPNAGYRIARAAIHNYGAENFRILIPTYCKSAGTLICIGATGLVMADQAELGPLDVQLRKQDEIFQQSSGLDILRGVTYLQKDALESFKSYWLDINGGAGLSTRVASQIASDLVIGLYEPLFSQVDPVKLGEMNAALDIAQHYGERLDKKSSTLHEGALTKLIMGYPTHGFVIDRSEARQLFKSVTKPDAHECSLGDFMTLTMGVRPSSGSSAIVLPFNPVPPPHNTMFPPENPDESVPAVPPADAQPADVESADEHASKHPDGTAPDDESEQPTVGSQQDDAVTDGAG